MDADAGSGGGGLSCEALVASGALAGVEEASARLIDGGHAGGVAAYEFAGVALRVMNVAADAHGIAALAGAAPRAVCGVLVPVPLLGDLEALLGRRVGRGAAAVPTGEGAAAGDGCGCGDGSDDEAAPPIRAAVGSGAVPRAALSCAKCHVRCVHV